MGKSSSVTSSFSGITQGYTELANPCGGMFSGPARRDLVFQVNVQAAGLLVVTVDPSLSSGSASADVGYGVTTGSSCAGATPVGVCVNAAGVMGVESGPAIPVNAGTYFIWVSVASVSTGPLTRVEVTARLQ